MVPGKAVADPIIFPQNQVPRVYVPDHNMLQVTGTFNCNSKSDYNISEFKALLCERVFTN